MIIYLRKTYAVHKRRRAAPESCPGLIGYAILAAGSSTVGHLKDCLHIAVTFAVAEKSACADGARNALRFTLPKGSR